MLKTRTQFVHHVFTRAIHFSSVLNGKFSIVSHRKIGGFTKGVRSKEMKSHALEIKNVCSCIWYAIYRTADTHSINIDRNRYTKTSDYFLLFSRSLSLSLPLEILLVIRCYRLSPINIHIV